jgi:FkbM family methyltransferase
MTLPEISKDGVRRQLFRLFFRLVGVMPRGGIRRLGRVPGVRKTYDWLVRFSPQEMLVEVQGNKMYIIPPDSALSRELLLCGIYEKGGVRVFHELIRRGMNVVDLGANIGYFTLIAAKLVGPEGKVFAFEPEPKNFSVLQRNVSMNGYENVILVQEAVSDKKGVAQLHLRSDSWAHSLSSSNGDIGSISVPVTSLDQFFSEDAAIDFIKMDIEGAEGKAIQGMERILGKGDVKAMVVEFHLTELEGQGSSFEEAWHQFKTLGFEFYEMRDNGIREVDFQQALCLAHKQGEGVNLLCLRK